MMSPASHAGSPLFSLRPGQKDWQRVISHNGHMQPHGNGANNLALLRMAIRAYNPPSCAWSPLKARAEADIELLSE